MLLPLSLNYIDILIPAVTAEIFNPSAELVIPTGAATDETMLKLKYIHWQQKRK